MAPTITTVLPETGLKESLYQRDGLLCAIVMSACLLLAHPFVEMGFVDDWSYIKTAQVFADTGHFVYNGWATATLGWQVLWGALFSKLLGFSFVYVRLSTLPIAAATVYLFHQILIRFGITRGNAAFGALVLGLSPVFLAMSASYMTDVPGLFCILLCLYLCQIAIAAETKRSALLWLGLAVITNLIGGTVRQTAWLGVLFIVPSAIWLLRKQRDVLVNGAAFWMAGVVAVYLGMRWFNSQPYFLPSEPLPPHLFKSLLQKRTIFLEIRAFLCLLLLVVPILAAWWSLVPSLPKRLLVTLSLILSLLTAAFLVHVYRSGGLEAWTAPWLIHVMGSMGTGALGDIPGPKPFTFGYAERMIISVIVLASGFLFFLHLFTHYPEVARTKRQVHTFSWRQIFTLVLPFTLAYSCALISHVAEGDLFDRYLLPLQAISIVLLLRYYQESARQTTSQQSSLATVNRFSVGSQVALLLLAYYAVAGTHDWFALNRARLQAGDEVLRTGVPRTVIQGGFEYDGWTQIEAAGYINDARIKIPAGAAKPVTPSLVLPEECTIFLGSEHFPAITPQYFLTFAPMSCFAPSAFPPVTYHTWMPPFVRKVYVQQRKD